MLFFGAKSKVNMCGSLLKAVDDLKSLPTLNWVTEQQKPLMRPLEGTVLIHREGQWHPDSASQEVLLTANMA